MRIRYFLRLGVLSLRFWASLKPPSDPKKMKFMNVDHFLSSSRDALEKPQYNHLCFNKDRKLQFLRVAILLDYLKCSTLIFIFATDNLPN